MSYIPDYTAFKAVSEKVNFILGPMPNGDPNKPYDQDFEIEFNPKNAKTDKAISKVVKILYKNMIDYEPMDGGKYKMLIKEPTNNALSQIFDILDNKVIMGMGWGLGESVDERYADDAFETDWVQMQNNAKGLGGRPKGNKGIEIKSKDLKGAFKITLKKGPGNYTDSEVEIIWPDGHKDKSTSLSKANDILRKIGNPKIGLDWEEMKESLYEAAPKLNFHADVGFVADLISRLGGIGRRHTGASITKDTKKAIKALQSLKDSIKREANIPY